MQMTTIDSDIPTDAQELNENPSTASDESKGDLQPYRSVCRTAVAATFFTAIALIAFNSSSFIFLPLISLVLALLARSSIAKYPDELVGRLPTKISLIGSIVILVGSIGLHTYVYMTEVPEGYDRITWHDLQPSEDNSQAVISEESIGLNGQRVFIKGYVYPNKEQTNLTAFVLVRDKGTCCFGGQPKATDMIYVKLEGDLRINYSWRLRKLGGIFSIDQLANQRVGKLEKIGYYRLTADYLK